MRMTSLKTGQAFRLKLLQAAGVALSTDATLNSLFLRRSIHGGVNVLLLFGAGGLFWASYRLWRHYRKPALSHRIEIAPRVRRRGQPESRAILRARPVRYS